LTLTALDVPPGAELQPALPLQGPSGISSSFSWTPPAAAAGSTYPVRFSVTDSAGQTGACSVRIDVQGLPPEGAPVARAGPDQWVSEGAVVTLDGRGSSASDGQGLTFQWSLLGGMGPEVTLSSATSATPSFTTSNDGVYTFQLTVTDEQGRTGSDTVTVSVTNVAPEVSVTGGSIDEGERFVSRGSLTDPGADSWSAQVNYGDGTGWEPLAVENGAFTLSHLYADNGTFAVELVVTDENGAQATAFVPVEVRNVLPIVNGPSSLETDEGRPFATPITLSDPGADTWWATVDYGDGFVDHLWLWNRELALNHFYLAGTYTLTITLSDEDGGFSTTTIPVVVHNVAPVVQVLGGTIDEGSDFYSWGSFEDPSLWLWWSTFTVTVDYGDGTGVQPVYMDSYNRSSFWLHHRYARSGTYQMTVTVTDGFGGVGTATAPVVVNSVAPRVFLEDAFSGAEGSPSRFHAFLYDPSTQDTWTATVDYGDGTGVQSLELTTSGSFELSHVYANDGVYVVTLTVTDSGGGAGSDATTAFVYNVTPEVFATGGESLEGSTFTALGSFTDPGADSWTAMVSYGDGTEWEPLALDGKSFELSHRYARHGIFYVNIFVTDDTGAQGFTSVVVQVHDVAPIVHAPSRLETTEGQSVTAPVTFSDPGEGPWSAWVDYGDGYGEHLWLWSREFVLDHAYLLPGTYTFTVTFWADGVPAPTSIPVVVHNVAPVVQFQGGTVDEGSDFYSWGSFEDPGLWYWGATFTASVDYGDGTGMQPVGVSYYQPSSFWLQHRYARSGTYQVTLTVTDGFGGVGTATAQVVVNNVAPWVYVGEGYGAEGSQLLSWVSFSDPGEGPWTGTVDYGDGTGVQPLELNSSSFELSHVYARHGVYTMTVTVTDAAGGVGSATNTVYVYNVAPEVFVTGGESLEGSTFSSSGSFTDPGADSWTARVYYGDGADWEPLALHGRSFELSHVYARSGTYWVHILVRDSAGGEGWTSAMVTVRNVAPVVTATGGVADEGSEVTLGAAFTDSGRHDGWVARIDYGDGSAVETRHLLWPGRFTVRHRYADSGTYRVTFSIRDDAGGVGTATVPVEVRNVAPTLRAFSGSGDLHEGSTYTGRGQVLDPGTDTWTLTVDYGDGSAPEQLAPTPGASNTFALSHVYDDSGLYTLTLTVTDEDGGVSTRTVSAQVLNVVPTVTASNDSPRYWGVPVNLVGAATEPSQADTRAGFTSLWSLGDGTTAAGLTTAHAYAAPGSYSARLRVTDKDSGSGQASTSVTVQQRPGAVTCEDTTAVFGFGASLRARFVDGLPGGLPGGRSLRFRVGASTDLGSTTDAMGLGSVQSPGALAPGNYPVVVSFAGDSHYTGAEASCTLTVTESDGQFSGRGLRFSNETRGGFHVSREAGGPLQGALRFRGDETSFHADTMTALGVSADQRRAWFTGVGRDGRAFTAYVEDNSELGTADVFRLWIDGVPRTGDAVLLGGRIESHGTAELTAVRR
jgi:PKD repeat protein